MIDGVLWRLYVGEERAARQVGVGIACGDHALRSRQILLVPTYMYTHYVYVFEYIYLSIYMYNTYIHTYALLLLVYTHMYIRIIYMYTCVYIYVIYIYIYVYIYICMYYTDAMRWRVDAMRLRVVASSTDSSTDPSSRF